MQIWYAIPTANKHRADACLAAWKSLGFKTAALIDAGAPRPTSTDLVIVPGSYPGYFASVNHLVKVIDLASKADIIVTGGDDIFPDPQFTAVELAKQFYERFPDGFGVMQPTGDPMKGTSEICGSPWFGRGWLDRAYRGQGPFFSGYQAFFGDEELKLVAESLGVLWQRPDVTQRHNHWTRPGGPPKESYQQANQVHWDADKKLFQSRKASGWPGYEPKFVAAKVVTNKAPVKKTRFDILICTLDKRQDKFNRLIESLRGQIQRTSGIDVHIISKCDDGTMSVGDKRQHLLEQARGDYIAFIDDDDRVSSLYISQIYEALKHSPDCVGIQGIVTFDGERANMFEHSIRHSKWQKTDGVYYRYPNHLNPVRRELALKAGFRNMRVGEDLDYANRLRPLIEKEHLISEPIYFYDYTSKK